MNAEWSELNKTMQNQISKKVTFDVAITTLLTLRQELLTEVCSLKENLKREDFNAIPFKNVKGYHSKTIAYSLWHIFRIEDIVAHSLILNCDQVFFRENFQKRINSPTITTGNELVNEEIEEFSKLLNLEELYQYLFRVNEATTKLLRSLSYSDLKIRMTDEKKEYLKSLQVVSENEEAYWLIDYWCGKNIRGLVQMPFSRHWIMHIEASIRIKNKIISK